MFTFQLTYVRMNARKDMRIIKKKIRFGCREGQPMYHEHFNNYKEFYDTIMRRQPTARKTIQEVFDEHDKSWMGVNSIQEAHDLLMGGWSKPLEDIKVKMEKNLRDIERQPVKKTYADVVGYVPIVPNVLMGLPKSMVNIRQERVGSRILRFLIMIDRAWKNDTETIIRRMSKTLAQIAALERTGKYRCRIEVSFAWFGDSYDEGKTHASCSVLVKSENQLFDVKRLCFPIIHPGMLRLLMFAWYESIPLKANEYFVSGYGRAFECWEEGYKKDYVNAVNENNEKVIVCDLNGGLEQVLKDY